MDQARKKELREQYRQMRTEMGIFAFRCPAENKVYLGASQNVPSTVNSTRFQLKNNSFPSNRRIMADWQKHGEAGFLIETLETLDYDKDNDLKTDYHEDLAVLKEFWREKLLGEGLVVENLTPRDR